MKRQALTYLNDWKKSNTRRPLIIRGARQTGKTWVVREFAKEFENLVEVNLESQPEMLRVFSQNFGEPKKIISELELLLHTKINSGKTLLFIDEIQESKEALKSLRYFFEKIPDLHVIAAGSLLEFAFKEIPFPVGRIEFLYLFPINFKEYLMAKNREDLIDLIHLNPSKISDEVHKNILEELSVFMSVGGMPEALSRYVETQNIHETQANLQLLTATYRSDFNKYATRVGVEHLKLVYDSIPKLLGQKFVYTQVSETIRSNDLHKAIILLEEAGLVKIVYHTNASGLPLSAGENHKKFKIFFLDIGLAHRTLGMPLNQVLSNRSVPLVNLGGISEQFVAQELISLTKPNEQPNLHYWHREEKSSKSEIDFVIQVGGKILPIEVKSGAYGHLKSLHRFMEEKKSSWALKVYAGKYRLDEKHHIEHIPFYMLWSWIEKCQLN